MGEIETDIERWKEQTLNPWLARGPQRKKRFETKTAGIPMRSLYTPSDVEGPYAQRVGFPGEYPYVRGIYPTMYRSRLWTIRQYSGYGTAEETNLLFRDLLKWGETGLSLAFDLPTQCGYDSNHPLAEGEVGTVGVAVNTLRDMERIFQAIPLDKVSTSMTINATAPILLAMYIAVAEKQGISPPQLAGTVQNDVLKEAAARNAWMLDIDASMKLSTDVIEYCAKNMPRWNPISITEYHFREAGANAVDAAAFMLADAMEYVKWTLDRGFSVDDFARRLSFHLAIYTDLFEEVARCRALRRLWANIVRDRFKAKNPESCLFRFAGTAGGGITFTRQSPLVNLVRGTLGLLGCVLGGAQAAWVTCYDEGFQIPSREALKLGIRTAQVVAEETSIADTVDPLAGSYFLEKLTDEIEKRMRETLDKIDNMGGALHCIKKGYYQNEISKGAYEWQKRVENGERTIIGLNKYREDEEKIEIKPYEPDPRRWDKALESLNMAKSQRNSQTVKKALENLKQAAKAEKNLMPYLIEAVRAYSTVGEISDVLRDVYGSFKQIEITT
jgi:methylmalonyl-CoA mutase N-terminal domain/subunit